MFWCYGSFVNFWPKKIPAQLVDEPTLYVRWQEQAICSVWSANLLSLSMCRMTSSWPQLVMFAGQTAQRNVETRVREEAHHTLTVVFLILLYLLQATEEMSMTILYAQCNKNSYFVSDVWISPVGVVTQMRRRRWVRLLCGWHKASRTECPKTRSNNWTGTRNSRTRDKGMIGNVWWACVVYVQKFL
jgi:hypothetical protein